METGGSVMFCTSCGSLVSPTSAACPVCETPILTGISRSKGSPSRSFAFGRIVLSLLPVLALALAVGVGWQRWEDHQRQQEVAYRQAEIALEQGDFAAAELGFSALGGYHDADERLADVRDVADPILKQLDSVMTTIDSGDYTGAIALLKTIVAQAPGYAPAADLLESTRAARIEELTKDAANAEANRDWLRAELALRELNALQPVDVAIAEQLQAVVREHGTIAFARDGAVFVASIDGSAERPLTTESGAIFPSWSPDRSHIAFIATTEGENRFRGMLMLMKGDGSDLRAVASDVLPYSWPVWSPDGGQIAYSSIHGFDTETFTGAISLNVYDVARGAERDLTGDQLEHAAVPTWSPDGRAIAFVSNTIQRRSSGGIELQDGDVYSVPSDGGPVRNLTESRVFDESWVQWSPAGDRLLVFTAPGDWSSPAKSKLYLLQAESRELNEIVIDEWQTSLPLWSPDGRQIAYVTGGDTVNIWSDQGLQWVQLGAEVSSFVTWSPDGRYLMVPPVGDSQIAFVVNVAEDFGTVAAVELEYDSMRSGNGPPVWGGFTSLAPVASLAEGV